MASSTQHQSHFQAVTIAQAQPVARPTTLTSIALRTFTSGMMVLCVAAYSIATVMVELLWNASVGDMPALAESFSLPLLK